MRKSDDNPIKVIVPPVCIPDELGTVFPHSGFCEARVGQPMSLPYEVSINCEAPEVTRVAQQVDGDAGAGIFRALKGAGGAFGVTSVGAEFKFRSGREQTSRRHLAGSP